MTSENVFHFIKKYSIIPENDLNTYTINGTNVPFDSAIIYNFPTSHKCNVCVGAAQLEIYKKSGLLSEDKKIIENISKKLNALKGLPLTTSEIDSILATTQIESILQCLHFSEDVSLPEETFAFFIKHIKEMEKWSAQTYENQGICFGIGIVPETRGTDIHIDALHDDDMLKVLTSGVETLIVCDTKGKIVSYDKLPDPARRASASYERERTSGSIHAFRKIASWSRNKLAVLLTQRGDILLFADGVLKFAKRRSNWHIVRVTPLLHMMEETRGFDPSLKTAIAETCLDASFRRTGACIGIIDNDEVIPHVLQDDDIIDIASKTRTKFFKRIVGQQLFQNIPREVRQELVAIDGATVLKKNGDIVAIGAILKINNTPIHNRTMGGRSVAAQQLACRGFGIKVSADGGITGWRNQHPQRNQCPREQGNNDSECPSECHVEKCFELF